LGGHVPPAHRPPELVYGAKANRWRRLDTSTENSHVMTLPRFVFRLCSAFSLFPVPHTGDPDLTSGRVKGGEAIT
jgi:hypothetical protein